MSRLPSLPKLQPLGGLPWNRWRRPPRRDYPAAEDLAEGLDLTGDDEVDATLATGELPRQGEGADSVLDVQELTLRFGGLVARRSAMDEERVIDATTDLCRMMGLQAYENKFCAELSYGTLRLVELAAIMALKPKFLLLVEPSSGISQKETEQLLPLLRDVRAATGSTILIIEHDMPLIMQLSDHIYAMAAGAVISSGTPDEVQSDPGVIESYLGTSRYGTVVGSNA